MDLTQQISGLRRQSYDEYQNQAAHRIAAFDGDWVAQVREYIRTHVSAEHWFAIGDKLEFAEWQNLLQDIITRTTRTYVQAARRRLVLRNPTVITDPETGEEEEVTEDPNLAIVLEGLNLDRLMDSALKRSLAAGLAMARPWVDDSGSLRVQILTPDQFTLITAYDDPSKIVGLQYQVYQSHFATNRVGSTWLWDMEGLAIAKELGVPVETNPTKEQRAEIASNYAGVLEMGTSGSGTNENILNQRTGSDYPYKDSDGNPLLPFAAFTPELIPELPFNPFVGQGLYSAALNVAYISTRKAWLQVLQSHKQFVLTGPGVDQLTNQIMDPALPVVIAADAGEVQIDILDLATDPAILQKAIDDVLETELLKRGWTKDDFVFSANRQTAEAMEIRNEGRDEYDEHLATDVARPAELAFLNILRVVWAAEGGSPKLSENADFDVDFARNTKRNIIGNIDDVLKTVEAGFLNAGDVVSALDDNVETRDQGIKQAEENIRDWRMVQGFSADVTAVLDAVPPPVAEIDDTDDIVPAPEES